MRSYRADKDEYLRTSDGSPIPAADRPTFAGLPYFDVDEAYRFEGLPLEPYTGDEPVSFQIPTSDGKLRPAERAGTFTFELAGGRGRSLRTLRGRWTGVGLRPVPRPDQRLGVVRRGPLSRHRSRVRRDYALDFNLAYHPSCVYDPQFSCPLTPAENRLPVQIEAGERL